MYKRQIIQNTLALHLILNTRFLIALFHILDLEMETVPSCDTFQSTSILTFSQSEHIATTQIKEFIEKQRMAI